VLCRASLHDGPESDLNAVPHKLRSMQQLSEAEKERIYIRWLRQNTGHYTNHSAASQELCEHAWETARKAAKLLKDRYGVNRVRVFGSLVQEWRFHPGSDIDLAVEGLEPADYWEALTSVMFLDDQVSIEMVDQTTCRPEIWSAVEQEGIDL
jgi:predicted nucleotidyltransferase